jgi:DNA-binding Xre family transcriptional regulator
MASYCDRIVSVDQITYNRGMKTLKSNLAVLTAQKGQREKRRISLRTVAEENDISRYTIYAFAQDELKDYPKAVLEKLCTYFNCTLDDLFTFEEIVEGQ